MRFKKTAAVGAALAMLAAGFGGATTSASGETTTLRLWLNGTDTPADIREYAIAQFKDAHPEADVVIEEQQWTGLVERLTTALASSDSPDVVEFGNTQVPAFAAAGALLDLTEYTEQLAVDDLLESGVEAGMYDGSLFAPPYYAGVRVIIYRTDLFEEAGIEIPTTIEEMAAAAEALMAANSDVPNFSGFYFPGRNWYAALPFIWDAGGDIAVLEGDQWVGKLATPESVAGLTTMKNLMDVGNRAPLDGDDANDFIAFCAGEVGMMPAPGWKPGQIIGECPEMEANIGAFAMPGTEAGTTAPQFLGGSNLGVSANSQNPDLAVELLTLLLSAEYQAQLAGAGLIPARISQLGEVSGSPAAVAQAEAVPNSGFVPASEHWIGVEEANILPDMIVAIAQGGDIQAEAERADAAIEELLNQ